MAYSAGMTGLVWVALDGVGHPLDAPPGSAWEQDLPTLRPLVEAGLALETTLGVAGLPQSGTGQACWLTGRDAVALMGEHFGPQPGPTLQRLLSEFSLPARLKAAGGRAALLNFYAPAYFGEQRGGRNRMGCFPFSFHVAGLPLNPPDLPLVRASLGLDYAAPWAPFTSVQEQRQLGQEVAQAAHGWDVLVMDLWFSDLLGHQGSPEPRPEVQQAASAYLRRVDALLTGLLDGGAQVILSSDHGNMEDLTVKSHTLARVPFAGAGVNLGHPANVVEGGRQLATLLGLN